VRLEVTVGETRRDRLGKSFLQEALVAGLRTDSPAELINRLRTSRAAPF
jgi:hypothetical protein